MLSIPLHAPLFRPYSRARVVARLYHLKVGGGGGLGVWRARRIIELFILGFFYIIKSCDAEMRIKFSKLRNVS